jgi:hypothetical protein
LIYRRQTCSHYYKFIFNTIINVLITFIYKNLSVLIMGTTIKPKEGLVEKVEAAMPAQADKQGVQPTYRPTMYNPVAASWQKYWGQQREQD